MIGVENDFKIVTKVTLVTIICMIMGFISMCEATKMASKYTPVGYVKQIWKQDSIYVTEKSPELASDYVMNILKNNSAFENPKLEDARYDKLKKEYKIRITHQKKIDNDKFHKGVLAETYWVKLDFKTNNGDYIVTPIITLRTKSKDFVKIISTI